MLFRSDKRVVSTADECAWRDCTLTRVSQRGAQGSGSADRNGEDLCPAVSARRIEPFHEAAMGGRDEFIADRTGQEIETGLA